MRVVIELEDVYQGYGDGDLLKGISLNLSPGSFHVVSGPTGAGKTTLLGLCTMHLRPRAGRIRVFGAELTEMARDEVARARRRIGVVQRESRFLDHLPLVENVALPIAIAGEDPRERAEEVGELLAWVGLADRALALPPELSGGERQRAALARAVVMSPEVIVADEPTGSVDGDTATRLLTLLAELNRLGKAVLLATHDLALVEAVTAQREAVVLKLADGRLQPAGRGP